MERIVKIAMFNFKNQARSYSFLITLFAVLILAISFIPNSQAEYSVIKFGSYQGSYNSSWVSSLSTIMSGIFLSFFGYFLICSSIESDRNNRLGEIISASRIKNYQYLMAKGFANFLVLSLIALIVVFVNYIQLLYFNKFTDLNLWIFIKPFIIVTLPTIALISGLAIILEVFFKENSLLRYGVFIFIFLFFIFQSNNSTSGFSTDFLGVNYITQGMQNQVKEITHNNKNQISTGYLKAKRDIKYILDFKPVPFSTWFIINRLILIFLAIGLILLSTIAFDRFKFLPKNNRLLSKDYEKEGFKEDTVDIPFSKSYLKSYFSSGISYLIIVETKLIFRKGIQWTWGLYYILIGISFFFSKEIVGNIFIPLFFLFLALKISNLFTRDYYNRTTYISETGFRPIRRILIAKIISGWTFIVLLISPILIRFTIQEPIVVFYLLNASLIMIMISCLVGLISKSNRPFEILLIILAYANINKVDFLDYYGGLHHSLNYLLSLVILNIFILIINLTFLYLKETTRFF